MTGQNVSDFIKGTGREVTVGTIIIRELSDGSFWMERTDCDREGEGTQVSRERLESELLELYGRVF